MKKVSRRRAKRSLLKKQVPAAGICLLSLGCPIVVLAAPVGGVVTVGSASITSSGVTTTINQASNKAAINWQSFGIASGETVRFVQPSASSIALNRVLGSDASAIYGTLSANGQVFLINPNGILFAPGAQVNVAGLVASTLNISDSDFLSGNYRFSKDGSAGSVINQGNISANNGYVAFLGPQVKNEGIVAAKVIGLTAGDKVSLDFNGDSLLKLTVDTIAAGASASNSGSLLADGGTVLMSTGTKDALLSTVVNNSGLIQARTVNNISGTIILEGGTAHIGGTLDASGLTAGQTGGTLKVLGDNVTLASGSLLNASGDVGGGTILVGGAYQGGAGEYAATRTTVAAGATLSADAATTGNGGQVVVWSNDTTRFAGTITARGGALSGNGGSVETSGKKTLKVADSARVDTTAAKGKTGNWLLDPMDFTVGSNDGDGDITANALQTALGTSDVTITTTADGTNTVFVNGWGNSPEGTYYGAWPYAENGDIHINAPVTWVSDKTLTLSAYRNININEAITGTSGGLTLMAGTGGSGTISATAGVSVNSFRLLGGSWVQLNANLPTFSATNFFLTYENLDPGGSFLRAKGGSGASGDPYMIADVYGLQGIGSSTALRGNHYKLANNIDAGGTVSWNNAQGFTPIGGNAASAFTGGFDGGGYNINGLTVNKSGGGYAGLFGYASGATIANVGLTGGGITATLYVGGLVGYMDGGSITNSYSTGNVTAINWYMDAYVGGLAGYMKGGNITNSYATGSVTNTYQNGAYANNSYAGGLVGYLEGNITGSYATGSVTATRDKVGGLVGAINGTITDSYATGSVTGVNKVGGLAGEQTGGTITSSYAAGRVIGTGSNVGGLAGLQSSGSVTNSYWDKDTTGQATSAGGGTGLTTAQLMSGLPTGFSSDVWGIIPGTSYPYLKWNHPTTPQVVSGFVKDASGATQAGQTVQTLANGNLVGSTSSGANGFYYMLLGNNSIADSKSVLSFVNTQGGTATFTTAANQNLTGFDITTGRVTVTHNDAINVTSVLGQAKGGNTDDTRYTVSGSNVSVNGDLYVTAAGEVVGDALAVSGATTVNAGSNNITLDSASNDFIGALTLTGNNVTLRDANALTLGASTVSGTLSVTAGGNVTQTGALGVSGATTVNAGVNDITLDNAGNDFTGSVSLTGNNVTLRDTNALALGASIIGGDLTITAAGNVTQTGALAVTGATTVNAGGNDIILNNTGNDFSGPVNLTGNNVTLRDTNDLTLGAITAPGSLTLTAGGTITTNDAISTALFDLKAGDWVQINATLPTFSATDFRISGGSFLRALGGDGNSGSPYQISDVYGLQGIGSSGTLLTKHYSLANNIDASGTSAWNGGAGFKPIGIDAASAFSGSFDGGSHTISNLTINRPGTNEVGLFGHTNGATLANVGLTNVNVFGGSDVGGLVGKNTGNISNVYITGTVIDVNTTAGGLVGQNSGGNIGNSYAAVSVSGGGGLGGLVGKNTGSISNSFATGSVSGSAGFVGGLVGFNTGTITSSYWGTQTSGQATSAGGTGLTTAQMKDAANYSSWDTAAVWYLNGSQTAPLLRSFLTPLTVSADSVSKVYDGTATAALTNVTAYDAAKVGGTLAWDGKNVGSYSLTGLYTTSQQGYLIDYDATALLTITPRALTASVTAASKVYDGTTEATISGGINLGNLIGGDTVSATYISGDFADKHVGDNKTVTLAGISLTGADAGNYSLAADSVTSSASITPKTLTITAVTDTKPYDGTTSSGGGPAVSGLVVGVGDTIDGLSQAFANKNVLGAGNSTLNVSGYTINDGNNGQNYTVITQSATGSITPKALTAALTGTAEKVYDGTTAATLTNANFHLFDLITGDAVSVSGTSASYADKNVDSLITVTATGLSISGADAGNYTISGDASGNIGVITPRALTGSVTAANKVYDRTTAATIDAGVTLGNLIDGDTVSASHAGGEFSDWNVGDNKTVNLSGISLTGADAGNYSLASSGIASNASITPATLTLTSLGTVEKVYDGTATAMVNAGNQPTLQGGFAGDNVALTFTHSSAAYDNKNVGDNKTVTLSGLTLGGTDAGNYQLASTSISGNVGKITPAALTITASANSKVYDGTTSAAATPTVSGLMVGDSFSGLSQTYDNKNAGNGKTLTVTGYTINDGNNGGNYTITLQNNTSGEITPAQLTYTAAAASREQDRDNPLLSGSISGIASGDSLAAVTSGSLTWLTTATKSSPAGRYAITGSGLSVIDGNYLADILQAPGNAMALTVRAQQGGAGYQNLLPWIVQANHANGNRLPEGIGATAGTDASAPAVRHAARYAAGEASSGNVDGGAVFGLPLRIVGSGVNVGGHRTVAPLLQISTQEERKPHAL